MHSGKEIPLTELPNLRIVLRHSIDLQERALIAEEIDIKDVTVFASRRDSIQVEKSKSSVLYYFHQSTFINKRKIKVYSLIVSGREGV